MEKSTMLCVERFNIVTVSILPKSFNKFNPILINLRGTFLELDKVILNLDGRVKGKE